MDDWVIRAMARWPNVPALFGWLALDRRGDWRIQGERIRHPRIIEVIDRNYAADEHGRWFFQNGPQRGYIQLESAPYVLRVRSDEQGLETHTGLRVHEPRAVFLDETGSLFVLTEHGAGEVAGGDLDWILTRLRDGGRPFTDEALQAALDAPSSALTGLQLELGETRMPIERVDFEALPQRLGFERDPKPRSGERFATREMD